MNQQEQGSKHLGLPIGNGRFVPERVIYQGNQSTVIQARDTVEDDEIVAVKLFDTSYPDDLKKAFFERETAALERLTHPHIIRVRYQGWDETRGCNYVVFDYIPRTLLDFIQETRPSGEDEGAKSQRLTIMQQLCDAIVYAHTKHVVHRDIKPTNVLIDDSGLPVLTDFGTSRIKTELSVGMTVRAFHSPGYASPEQCRGEKGDERSDIYSLGAVYYHLLSGQRPSADGAFSLADIDQLILPGSLRNVLKKMVAIEPEDRYATAADVARDLLGITDYGYFPEILIHVSSQAVSHLYDFDVIHDRTFDAAAEWLEEAWGGQDLAPVAVNFRRPSKTDLLLFSGEYRFRCRRDASTPALVVEFIDRPYLPDLESQIQAALPFRALWSFNKPSVRLRPQDRLAYEQGRTYLLDRLSSYEAVMQGDKRRRERRRSYMDDWEKVLLRLRSSADSDQTYWYSAVNDYGDRLVFHLRDTTPSELTWDKDSQIAIKEHDDAREIIVGTLLKFDGSRVVVAKDELRERHLSSQQAGLPEQGILLRSELQRQSSIQRQSTAVRLLREGQTDNPRLLDVFMNPSRAEFNDQRRDLRFFQDDLAEDKRDAVRRALAARDLFLIQGPPGTGKTKAIAEIILQILADNPRAKILVTSQSNEAVNNALERVAKLNPSIKIVRIAREGRIGRGAEIWTVEQRLNAWRSEVLERCAIVLSELRRSDEPGRDETDGSVHLPAFAVPVIEWMSMAEELVHLWRETEQSVVAARAEASEDGSDVEQEAIDADIANGQELLDKRKADVATCLDILRGMLPDEKRGTPISDLDGEYRRLQDVVGALLRGDEPEIDDQASRLIAMIERWCALFGKTKDFEGPLLERANILAATCQFSGGGILKRWRFDWAIVDEAGRATAPDILIPLVRSRRAILVGDERQLPPQLDEKITDDMLRGEEIERGGLEQSLFEAIIEAARADPKAKKVCCMLTRQHRMHPAIGNLISAVFYRGGIENASVAEERMHGIPWINRPIMWYSTSTMSNRYEEKRGTSQANLLEAGIIELLITRMEHTYREAGQETRPHVVVISGYAEQVREIDKRLKPDDKEKWTAIDLDVATIDSIQGRDCDIVVYSTVRSNKHNSIGFLADRRRLNVALSRAGNLLCIVGDHMALQKANIQEERNPFVQIVSYMQKHEADCRFIDATEVGQ